ncbi:MAG: hypothetical protein HYY02_07455, partial [Chloroflexi bacterium]|nr:hypothetical protein [Chloroflexota bacterium]
MPDHKHLSRRTFLRSLAVAWCAASGLGLKAPSFPQAGEASIIGWSQGGLPLSVHRYGEGPLRLLILGGQHGGPEANTTELAHLLMNHLAENPQEIPPNVTVHVLPKGNPDGLVLGSRQYRSEVDPNRNWGSPDWQSDAYDSNGRYRPGLGGPEPFSEQETAALGNWLWRVWPQFTINYHSVGGFMFGGGEGLSGELAELYSNASGYPRPTGGGGRSPLGYRATGNMNGWQRSVGMGGCLIELASAADPEFERN